MALLDNTQATYLYDNGNLIKVDKDSVFQCYYLQGSLDGYNYYLDTSSAGTSLDENSTDADIKTDVITELEKLEYQGVKPVILNTVVTKV